MSRAARVALLASLFAAGGCSQWLYELGTPVQPPQEAAVHQGASLAEVLQHLGPPHRLSALPGGYLLAWEHWLIDDVRLGFSLGAVGTDFLTVDWGTARARGEFLMLSFDRRHGLSGGGFATWDGTAGGGRALQPLFGIVPVVDVDDLLERMQQHRWGAASLDPLPVTLNLGSSTATGQGGIERRGTPSAAGQHSLEINNR